MGQQLVIDILTILVMSLAVFYAARLNRSLTRARDGRAELVQLIASLTDAQTRAEAAIQTMKATAADYELSLSKQIAVSRGLAEELSMINDTGNMLATRLERLASLARTGGDAGRGGSDIAEPGLPTLRAERPLLSGSEGRPARSKPAETPAPAKPSRAPEKTAEMSADSKSRAERELFAAIETLRKGRPS